MNRFNLEVDRLGIEYDRDYGRFHLSGWSICWRGSYAVQFEPWLIVALWKAWRRVREWEC